MKTETAKHTPGPWVNGIRDRWVREQSRGTTVARICEDQGDLDETPRSIGEVVANARLIAAAPDLLRALMEIVSAADAHASGEYIRGILDPARAAIANAEGRS